MLKFRVSHGGRAYDVEAEAGWNLGDLASELGRVCNVLPATVKLLRPKAKHPVVPGETPHKLLSQVGLSDGDRLMMVASKAADVEYAQAQRELPRMRGFEEELVLSVARRRATRQTIAPPAGKYTFRQYEVLGPAALGVPVDEGAKLQPPSEAALALLHRLAADPGIVGIMNKHKWSVGILKEMPPEGKVGVSPVCILGLNVNHGQEIHLRLRTDDLKGFRRYHSIRDTLVHELTHMVWSGHDINFKQLNSQLLRECSELSWTEGGVDGNTLARGEVFAGETEEKASLGCWTLRDFLAGGTDRFERYDAATAAAEAAVLRLEQGAASALSREALEAEQEGASKTKAGARACRADGGDDAMDLDRPSGTAPVPSPDMGNTPHTHVDVHPHDPALADLPDGQGSDTTSHVVVSTPSCCSEAAADAAEGQTTAALDPSQESYRKLELALGELVRSVPRQEVNGVLSTLETILRNALEKPEDERFRQLRCSNRLFLSRVGRHICAVQVLQAAGFRYLPPVGGGGTSGAQIRPLAIDNISQLIMSPGGQEGLFCLMRDDPGLLWLTLSAVREASEQQRTAC